MNTLDRHVTEAIQASIDSYISDAMRMRDTDILLNEWLHREHGIVYHNHGGYWEMKIDGKSQPSIDTWPELLKAILEHISKDKS